MSREHLGCPLVNRADPFTEPRILKLEQLRLRKRISIASLSRAAQMKTRTWPRIVDGRQVPQRETLQRVEAALNGLPAQFPVPERLLAGVYRGALALLAREHQITLDAIEATDFSVTRAHDASWRLANRCRQMAVYLVKIEYEITGEAIGALAGVSKMAVSKTLETVEDWRDDPKVDALLDRVRAIVAPELRG